MKRLKGVYPIRNDTGWQLDMATMSKTIHSDMRNRAQTGDRRHTPLFYEKGYNLGQNGFYIMMERHRTVNYW